MKHNKRGSDGRFQVKTTKRELSSEERSYLAGWALRAKIIAEDHELELSARQSYVRGAVVGSRRQKPGDWGTWNNEAYTNGMADAALAAWGFDG